MKNEINEARKHKNGKGQIMQTSQGLRQALIITGQTTEAGHPGKGAFDDPASGQQDKAVLGLRQFDDFQVNAMFSSSLVGLWTGIAWSTKAISTLSPVMS